MEAVPAGNNRQPGVSPRSGYPPPKERQFGQPNANPGNKKGRPQTFTNALKKILKSEKDEEGKRTAALEVMASMMKQAKKGDVQAARLVIETLQGKPDQTLEHAAKGNTSINIRGEGPPAEF